jgi:thymidine kinase
MFSGKSSALVKHIRKSREKGRKFRVYKHTFDTRYHAADITTHNGEREPAVTVKTAADIETDLAMHRDVERIFIDECQWFDSTLILYIDIWIKRSIKVMIAGLDLDSQGRTFGCTLEIAEAANKVIRCYATCGLCSAPVASHTIRDASADQTVVVLVGGAGLYKPACYACFTKHTAK